MNLHTDNTLIRIVDPDGGYRQTMASLLRREGWEVSPHPNVASLLRDDDLLRPGIIISAVCSPYVGGLELLSVLKKREIDLPVVFVSDSSDVAQAVSAMKLGAADYLLKSAPLDFLVDTVSELLDIYIAKLLENAEIAEIKVNLQSLTAREREVLELFSCGLTTKEVARILGIAPKTVESHRCSIHTKFGIDKMSRIIYQFMRVRRDFK